MKLAPARAAGTHRFLLFRGIRPVPWSGARQNPCGVALQFGFPIRSEGATTQTVSRAPCQKLRLHAHGVSIAPWLKGMRCRGNFEQGWLNMQVKHGHAWHDTARASRMTTQHGPDLALQTLQTVTLAPMLPLEARLLATTDSKEPCKSPDSTQIMEALAAPGSGRRLSKKPSAQGSGQSVRRGGQSMLIPALAARSACSAHISCTLRPHSHRLEIPVVLLELPPNNSNSAQLKRWMLRKRRDAPPFSPQAQAGKRSASSEKSVFGRRNMTVSASSPEAKPRTTRPGTWRGRWERSASIGLSLSPDAFLLR